MENTSTPDASTVPVTREPSGSDLQSSLELHVSSASGKREIVPVRQNAFDYLVPGGPTLHFSHQRGLLTFKDLSKSCAVYKDGIAKPTGQLEVGSSLEVGSYRILLWDTGVPAAFLKGCTAPFSNDIWPLAPGQHTVGRPGKRVNAISLDHPTVSREHARILAADDGRYYVVAEVATNPVYLRGTAIEPGAPSELSHGDLVEVGELIFRFHKPQGGGADEQVHRACIKVDSLGSLNVTVAGTSIPDKAWKTQYIKWLFAHLAYAWGRPLGSERLIDELWPESDPEKARNNFKFSLSTLRALLRSHLPESMASTEVILRSSSTLQLNPDLLDRHDVITIGRLVRAMGSVDDEAWEQDAQSAILAYSGPFLAECYLDWAVDARQSLELQVFDVARYLLERLEKRAKWEAVNAVASHILQFDRYAQWACLYVMRALAATGRPAEALRLFERNSKVWLEEMGIEPEADLLAEHERLRDMA